MRDRYPPPHTHTHTHPSPLPSHHQLSPFSILKPRNQYKLYRKSAITIRYFKMVQIHACDVLEDLAKLRSLIIKKKRKTNKQKTGKLSSFFGHNCFHIKPKTSFLKLNNPCGRTMLPLVYCATYLKISHYKKPAIIICL